MCVCVWVGGCDRDMYSILLLISIFSIDRSIPSKKELCVCYRENQSHII